MKKIKVEKDEVEDGKIEDNEMEADSGLMLDKLSCCLHLPLNFKWWEVQTRNHSKFYNQVGVGNQLVIILVF